MQRRLGEWKNIVKGEEGVTGMLLNLNLYRGVLIDIAVFVGIRILSGIMLLLIVSYSHASTSIAFTLLLRFLLVTPPLYG